MLSIVFFALLNVRANILFLLLLKELRKGVKRDKIKLKAFGEWLAFTYDLVILAPLRFGAVVEDLLMYVR